MLSDISQDGVVMLFAIHNIVLYNVHEDKSIDVRLKSEAEGVCASPSNELMAFLKDVEPALDIYSMEGNFSRKLHFDLIHGDQVRALAVMPWVDKPFNMAINTFSNKTEIRIYRLS